MGGIANVSKIWGEVLGKETKNGKLSPTHSIRRVNSGIQNKPKTVPGCQMYIMIGVVWVINMLIVVG